MKHLYFVFFFLLFSCNKEKKSSINASSDNIFYTKALNSLDHHQRDSAFIYFFKAKDTFIAHKDSIGTGKCLVNMAIIEADNGDYFGSQETSISATKYINSNNKKSHSLLSSNYNNLGITTNNLQNYEGAIRFYKLAIRFSIDSLAIKMFESNIANTYKYVKKYDSAISIYEKLKIDENQTNKLRVLDNLAFTKFLQNKNYNAEKELYDVLEIREIEKDFWGQNSSQSHLSDYFLDRNKKKSLFHARKMYEIATQLKSPDDQLEALQKLINLEPETQSKFYFNVYQKLNDSLQNSRNRAKNQFALIRYETEKNKTDFLKSQADNIRKQNQILKQYFALVLLAIGIVIGIFWYKKRKKLVAQEKEFRIKEIELKFSKKVHDVVANGIYQVMTKIENLDHFDKNDTLDELEYVYEKSRDISYHTEENNSNFSTKILQIANPYSVKNLEITLIGNEQELWEKISEQLKSEILIIFRELLVNMKKHSQAKTVSIKFQIIENELFINYFDNGIGLNNEFSKKNGLQNTENRIAVFGGSITFENPKKGLKITINIPVK